MTKTFVGSKAIAHTIEVAEVCRGSQNAKVGTPNTIQVGSSVHERRCKGDQNDELNMLNSSRENTQYNSKGLPNSGHSDIRSRISGKQTADAKQEKDKMGPGDDQIIKFKVGNSYKQIKLNQVGVGGMPTIYSQANQKSCDMSRISELQNRKFKRPTHLASTSSQIESV